MASMTPDQMDAFLARTRQAILLTTTPDGSPTGVPVWFDWDGDMVRMFSSAAAPKVARVEQGATWTMPWTPTLAGDMRAVEKFLEIKAG